MSEETFKLPDVARVGMDAPLRWLGKGWADFQAATLPALICGIILAGVSAIIAWALVFSGAFAWVFVRAKARAFWKREAGRSLMTCCWCGTRFALIWPISAGHC